MKSVTNKKMLEIYNSLKNHEKICQLSEKFFLLRNKPAVARPETREIILSKFDHFRFIDWISFLVVGHFVLEPAIQTETHELILKQFFRECKKRGYQGRWSIAIHIARYYNLDIEFDDKEAIPVQQFNSLSVKPSFGFAIDFLDLILHFYHPCDLFSGIIHRGIILWQSIRTKVFHTFDNYHLWRETMKPTGKTPQFQRGYRDKGSFRDKNSLLWLEANVFTDYRKLPNISLSSVKYNSYYGAVSFIENKQIFEYHSHKKGS